MTRLALSLALFLGACNGAPHQGLAPVSDIVVDWVICPLDPDTGLSEPNCASPDPLILALEVSVVEDGELPVSGAIVQMTSCSFEVALLPPELVDALAPELADRLDASDGMPVAVEGELSPSYMPGFAELVTDAEGTARVLVFIDRMMRGSNGDALPCPITISGGQDQTQMRITPRS
jgi:hypothetical protein